MDKLLDILKSIGFPYEDALDAAEIFYNKTETWIDSEKLYEVLYSFDMEGM